MTARPAGRIRILQALLLLGFGVVVARAAQVQLAQHERWVAESSARRTRVDTLPARRGTIYDRHGAPLALAQDFYRVQIATNEVRDTAAVLAEASRSLGADRRALQARFRQGPRSYPFLYGPFTATQVDRLRRMPGVHLIPTYQRAYPASALARPVVGVLDPETGHGASGLERMLDSLLAGTPGEQVSLRDRTGRTYESPQRRVRAPVDGHDVVLTLDAELQAIAETGLDAALAEMQAAGGDVVFLDPRTGDVLAVASRTAGRQPTASAFTDPFEPGSTAKLFTAAALLRAGRVSPTDTVHVADRLDIPGRGAPITDAKPRPGIYTLAEAIQVSSNVATVRFGQRLDPTEHFEMLRDFGVGSPTGIEFPSEAARGIPHPARWRPADQGPSMAMGYALELTALQLAAAYGVVANGGVLMAPTLVREIRAPDGRLVYRHRPDTVRRVVSPEVARTLLEYLTMAAGERGTGGAAQLAGVQVAGKTGTSRRVVNGRYTSTYVSSFAGVFPADDPQFVVIVKIDDPKGAYYGGETAAPLLRVMLEQALQARQSALSRSAAVRAAAPVRPPSTTATPGRRSPVAVTLPLARAGPAEVPQVAVPEVAGATVRAAALALHRRGLRVSLAGAGIVARVEPAAGTSVPAGTVVRLVAGRP